MTAKEFGTYKYDELDEENISRSVYYEFKLEGYVAITCRIFCSNNVQSIRQSIEFFYLECFYKNIDSIPNMSMFKDIIKRTLPRAVDCYRSARDMDKYGERIYTEFREQIRALILEWKQK